MNSYVADGKRIPHTPGSAVAVGDIVFVGTLAGLATEPIAAGELGHLLVEGVVKLDKAVAADDMTPGTAIEVNGSSQAVLTGGTAVGISVDRGAVNATQVEVLLNA